MNDIESQFENLEKEHTEKVNERFTQLLLVDNGKNNQQIQPHDQGIDEKQNIIIFIKSVLRRVSSKLFS